jgi:hypothetical protein
MTSLGPWYLRAPWMEWFRAVPNLTRLHLTSNLDAWHSDPVLIAVGSSCPKLVVLILDVDERFEDDLTDSPRMFSYSDNGLRALVDGCPLLCKVELWRGNFTASSVRHVRDQCPYIQSLTFPQFPRQEGEMWLQ